MPPPPARRTLENAIRRRGYERVAGVDEVGRGCLAGPVVAAAVVLDPERPIRGLRDSKLLSPAARERIYDDIVRCATAWTLASVEAGEIDRINIHNAALRAMHGAATGIAPAPDFVLVDGFPLPGLSIPQQAVVKGDRRCAVIAAASIVAKVTRDRLMRRLHRADPRYGFDRHKGYATAQHLAAIEQYGGSAAHRRSFRPFSASGRMT
ncbi:MAG: ribonuclease HII [Acidobacteria bacterium]|nr:ribonuclease HII [Acidobacteriota bacterium]